MEKDFHREDTGRVGVYLFVELMETEYNVSRNSSQICLYTLNGPGSDVGSVVTVEFATTADRVYVYLQI